MRWMKAVTDLACVISVKPKKKGKEEGNPKQIKK